MKPGASIIVPVRDRLALTRRCLESVWRHTRPEHEVIVVDNASRPATAGYLRRLARRGQARLARNAVNRSFAASINQGVRLARGEVFVWLNNDVIVGPQWLERLEACLRRAPEAAAAGPCTNDPLSGSGRGALHAPKPADLPAFAAAWSMRFDGQSEEAGRLSGFCLAVRRQAAEAVGLLDERFVWGEEDEDYCLRLRLGGFKLLLARDVFVFHEGAATRGALSRESSRRLRWQNRERFKSKWLTLTAELRGEARKIVRFLS